MGTVILADVSELTTIKISELPEATLAEDTDVSPIVKDSVTKQIARSKQRIGTGGSYGSLVNKTIAGGVITLSDHEHFVALTGEGDVADALTAITKTGGGNLDVGFVVLLTGKAGLAYPITLADAGNLKLQRVFYINNEYDSIPLIHRGSGIFQEMAGRASSG